MHVVVTGASSGIGRAIAVAYDKPGNELSLVARRLSLLEELRNEIGTDSYAIRADLADPADPVGWLREAEAHFGPVDILVNNAGVSYVEPMLGIDPQRIATLFQVNVHVPIAAIHHVLPGMLARRSGVIVNIASNAAFSPAPYFCHYTASKGALGNFSESLRMELKKSGVHVLSVYPGPVETPMGDRNWGQLKDSRSARMAPIGNAPELARLVVDAVEKRKARIIYPRFYLLGWWFPSIGRWIAERFVPEATGAVTPPLGGDLEQQSESR
jgi:short-subunit dehydrogenase